MTSPTPLGPGTLPHRQIMLFLSGLVTGRLTTRTGRYEHWVVLGTSMLVVDLILLSQIGAAWRNWRIGALMGLTGLGLGTCLPVVSTASQNAVELTDLGVVTAAVTFFRTLGGSFGIAGLGAVLRARFDHLLDGVALATPLPAGTTSKTIADHPADIRDLASPLRGLVEVALSRSVAAVFLTAIPLAVIGDSTIPKATDESSGQEPLAAAH